MILGSAREESRDNLKGIKGPGRLVSKMREAEAEEFWEMGWILRRCQLWRTRGCGGSGLTWGRDIGSIIRGDTSEIMSAEAKTFPSDELRISGK
jgi:hypothetical protein